MRFKKRKEPIYTNDLYYDLFDGGYIDPKELLVNKEDMDKVNKAVDTIRSFLVEAEAKGVLESE